MAEAPTSLPKKLLIKPESRALILNAPDGYLSKLNSDLPADTTIASASDGQAYDVVQLFVNSIADLKDRAEAAFGALKPGGVLWFAYPKKSGAIKTDISRDIGWEMVRDRGFEVVSSVAIDETWTALPSAR
ncbi:MAG: hypothetical protein U0528_15000 [Anaerolineae bacterium]